ncbi:putative virion structural protein [Erwinia phage vB_EamM_Caitlin]|uniref:putative virion structural protein n=1 Tax=Erwinia phage vB_EamM_Caitlin TaxID=1883379 RepID=UPI00081C9351|nr:putative virion structural protein [Erwinia phage vB_EamM_Caitlin]ANZ48456.1 putative virion structural protein [Erwinia phage vB_EamM_Caitlin]
MALKLKWKNPNVGATTIDIYRGDTVNVSLTTPLVTLTNGELSWVDTTALFGKTYYYVWAVNTATDRVVSRPQKIEVNDRKGPGPNLLMHGNESYGFFGTVASADFINNNTLLSVAKNLSGIPQGSVYPTWYKYIRNGKVLFVPNVTLGDTTWQSLYNAGFVYGANNNGPSGAGSVNQLTTFELNGDLFLVRATKAFPEGVAWDGTLGSYDLDAMPEMVGKFSEYEDLLFPMSSITPLRQRMVTVGDENFNSLLPPLYNNSARNTLGVCCQDYANSLLLQRGAGYNSYNQSQHNRNTVRACNRKTKTDTCVWWPVVEYIGRVGEVDLTKLGV